MQSVSNRPLIAARALRTTIKAVRHETEGARCLSACIVDKLIEAGLCRLTVPESLGGHEAEPLFGFDVYEELASADASVAWIAWNNALPGLLSRYLSNEVRAESLRRHPSALRQLDAPVGPSCDATRRLPSVGQVVAGIWLCAGGLDSVDVHRYHR